MCPPCVCVSTLCPPCVRLVSAVCPPRVRLECAWPRLQTLSALCRVLWAVPAMCHAMCPPCRLVSLESALACHFCVRPVSASKPWYAICPPCDRLVSATCPLWPRFQTLSASCVCLVCVHVSALLASGLCPLVGCCGAGPRHLARLYCVPASQFPWHSFWLHKISAFASAPYA